MKLSTIRKSLFFVFAVSVGAMGCELIVDFDRTKIPVETVDADIPGTDAGTDTGTDAIAETDGGEDASDDGGDDGGDATTDAETDAGDAGDASDAADAPP